jgi:hypothetical protein
MRCKCGEHIHPKRIEMGFRTCVKCSTTEAYRAHLVVHHKTGHTFDIVKSAEEAEELAKYSRNGFGASRGKRGDDFGFHGSTASEEHVVNSPKVLQRKTIEVEEEMDEESAKRVLADFDRGGRYAALSTAEVLLKEAKLSSKAYLQLRTIINTMK